MAATRCTVFIDGSNFYHGLRRLGVDSQDLDYRRMVKKLLVDRELRGVRYYVGRVCLATCRECAARAAP